MIKNTGSNAVVLFKLLVALVLLTGLILFAAQDLVPQMSYVKLFAYLLLGVAVLAVNLVGLVVIYLNISQWILRKGGTDPAWFWFASDPKGLVALREKLHKQ
jgi:hypothetical protein